MFVKGFSAFLSFSLLSLLVAEANLDRFVPVPGPEAYPSGVELSPLYRVLVKTAADPTPWDAAIHATATYRLWPDYIDPETLPPKHSETAVHVAQVDADQRIRIRVELLVGSEIHTLRLKPTRLAELKSSQRHGQDWIEFEVEPYVFTRSVLVEVNAPPDDTEALHDGLLLFLNPISKRPDGNVLELPAGVVDSTSPHMDDLNRILILPDSPHDALYIPSNTIVDGRIEVRKPGFKVMGRGMLIGSRWPFAKATPDWRESYPTWISPEGERIRGILAYRHPEGEPDDTSSHFEGLLVAHPYHFCITGAYHNENLKAFGWRVSSDGIHGVHKRGSFMRVNDDATYVNQGSIEDCVYWAMVNGACMQLGWSGSTDNNRHVTVKRVDVLRGEWDNLPTPEAARPGMPEGVELSTDENRSSNRAVLAGTYRTAQEFTARNKHFEDIRVDAQVNRLFYLGSRTGEVSYEHFTFKDIWFETDPAYPPHVVNVLSGKHTINEFVFDNFRIGDTHVLSLEDLEPLDQRNVHKVTFK